MKPPPNLPEGRGKKPHSHISLPHRKQKKITQ